MVVIQRTCYNDHYIEITHDHLHIQCLIRDNETVLLSFQRAELVANRSLNNSVDENTAFLANINVASSVAVFALQASGLGACIANSLGMCGGTLPLMPI